MTTALKNSKQLSVFQLARKSILSLAGYAGLLREQPYRLIIDISHCNLKCAMCPRGGVNRLHNPDKGLMKFDFFKKILDKFINEKVRLSSIEIGNWGDPLLDADLPRIIRYAKSQAGALKLEPEVSVNTTLNSLPNPLELLKSGVDDIRISISGMRREVYSRNHKGGSIDTVLDNIKTLSGIRTEKRLEKGKIRIVFHNYVYNREDATAARKFCAEYGLRFILRRTYILSVGDAVCFHENPDSLVPFYRNFIDLDEEMMKMKTMEYDDIPDCCLRKNCVTVNFDGQLSRCCGVFEKKHFMGSIFDYNIRDIPDIDSDICRICADTPISWRP